MTTAGDPPIADKQQLFEDLYDALADCRTGDHLGRMTQRFLQADQDAEVVALIDDGDRAVVYHPRAHILTATPFDAHSLKNVDYLWMEIPVPFLSTSPFSTKDDKRFST